jgi:hypothetical protein
MLICQKKIKKIILKSPGSGWVIDEIAADFKKYSKHIIVGLNNKPDILWSIDLFSFPIIRAQIPRQCISFIHIHHIDESKIEEYPFRCINREAYGCIVPNKITEEKAKKYLKIPIYRLPYWILSNRMKATNHVVVNKLKKNIGDKQQLIIGSFVKDGNGIKGDTPKLSKGPDILVDIIKELVKNISVKVILAGYCRNWVIKKFKENNIPYLYVEKYFDINSLYDCLDYYLVTSRIEGGPQSVLEASYRKIKILSTDVGIASDILHHNNICKNTSEFVEKILSGVNETEYNYKSVQEYIPEKVIFKYDSFFEKV